MEKVKEKVITGGCVFLVYLLIIGAMVMLNHRVDYIEGLAQANANSPTINK